MSNVLIQPFKPGDKVIRTGNFDFDPDLVPGKVYTVEKCEWSIDEWMLKLEGAEFNGYDPDNFQMANTYDMVAEKIFTAPRADEVPAKPTQHVYAVLDEMKGEYVGYYATMEAATRSIGTELATKSKHYQDIMDDEQLRHSRNGKPVDLLKVAYEIERLVVES